MENTESTPRREDPIPATDQGNGQSNNASQGLPSEQRNQQGGNSNAVPQADQSSTYRGQGGQEYDVDASDAVNRQADYSGNDGNNIETVTPETESGAGTDIESQRDSDQHINPGDKAPNKEFNR